MRTRSVLALAVLVVIAACGDPGSSRTTVERVTTLSTSATTVAPAAPEPPTTQASTTTTAVPTRIDTYRDEYVLATSRGEVILTGEHTADADRWIQRYGPDDDGLVIETVAVGDEQWERFDDEPWTVIDDPAADLFDHPLVVEDVLATFTAIGPDEHEGLPVEVYRLEGQAVADYAGPGLEFENGSITVAVFAGESFASYEIVINQDSDQWIRATYRIFDVGATLTIERPEVPLEVTSCRDPFAQFIEEVGSYRSRYDLLHSGSAFSSIEELRLLEPWAWQQTVRFRGTDAFIDTLWVNGGFQYWREPGGDWQEDSDGSYQSLTYRPFVDDLWIPDLVKMFDPVASDTINGRDVDVYELGLDDIRRLNDGLVNRTDTLAATFWIEPCSSPELLKLEVLATGDGYADGEFHIVYEVFDLGTTDSIDIPPAALDD